jgi:hypothetical protein
MYILNLVHVRQQPGYETTIRLMFHGDRHAEGCALEPAGKQRLAKARGQQP